MMWHNNYVITLQVLVHVLPPPLPIQLPVDGLEQTAENGSNVYGPATHLGDLDKVPGSWLQPSPALDIAFI